MTFPIRFSSVSLPNVYAEVSNFVASRDPVNLLAKRTLIIFGMAYALALSNPLGAAAFYLTVSATGPFVKDLWIRMLEHQSSEKQPSARSLIGRAVEFLARTSLELFVAQQVHLLATTFLASHSALRVGTALATAPLWQLVGLFITVNVVEDVVKYIFKEGLDPIFL